MNLVQVLGVAYDAGVRDPIQLARAGAVAMAESSGNPRAHNAVPPDDSYGLWQINMLGSLGPDRRARYQLASNDALYDPATNARVMFGISGGGTNWKPWSTYGGARFLLWYPAAQAAVPGVLAAKGAAVVGGAIDDAAQVVGGPLDAAVTAAQGVVKVGAWVSDRNNWWRVAKVVVGGGLVLGGIFAATRPAVMGAAGKVVSAVVPVGKAAKTLGKVAK